MKNRDLIFIALIIIGFNVGRVLGTAVALWLTR